MSRAIDSAGNAATSDAVRVVVDNTPPDTTNVRGPMVSTAEHHATFRFGSSERSAFLCSLDGSPYRTCMSPTTLRGLGAGMHDLKVEARDRAGNTDPTPAVWRWSVR
jgi:hypothetical protein